MNSRRMTDDITGIQGRQVFTFQIRFPSVPGKLSSGVRRTDDQQLLPVQQLLQHTHGLLDSQITCWIQQVSHEYCLGNVLRKTSF